MEKNNIAVDYEKMIVDKKEISKEVKSSMIDLAHKLVSTSIIKKDLYPNLSYTFSSNAEAIKFYDKYNILSVLLISISAKDLINIIKSKKINVLDFKFPPAMEDWLRNVYINGVKHPEKEMYKFIEIQSFYSKAIERLIKTTKVPNLIKYYKDYLYRETSLELFKNKE